MDGSLPFPLRAARPSRRFFLRAAAGAIAGVALHRVVVAGPWGGADRVRVGYWPDPAGLPLFLGLKRGLFQTAPLEVALVPLTSTQHMADALVGGDLDAIANVPLAALLALMALAPAPPIRIAAIVPRRADRPLDRLRVARASDLGGIADLQGCRLACEPGPQHRALARALLQARGVDPEEILELDRDYHAAAIARGIVAAAYRLTDVSPYRQGEGGRVRSDPGPTRVLEAGCLARSLLAAEGAWVGHATVFGAAFARDRPRTARRFADALYRSIATVRRDRIAALTELAGYARVEGTLADALLQAAWLGADELKPAAIATVQPFFDALHARGVAARAIDLAALLYRA